MNESAASQYSPVLQVLRWRQCACDAADRGGM